MEFNNVTPFTAIAWEHQNTQDQNAITALVRVKFKLVASQESNVWQLLPHPDQGQLFSADAFYGEEEESSVRYESDYITFKPNTDIIINAHARAPYHPLQTQWDCAVEVFDKHQTCLTTYRLRVTAEKKRYKVGFFWVPLGTDQQNSIPIRYEKSYGGHVFIPASSADEEDNTLASDPYNPIGCGICKIKDPKKVVLSPQVHYVDKVKPPANTTARHKPKKVPAGFGFIHRAWQSRLPYAGTYDQNWIDHKHPLPPKNFDPYYHQAAHPNLIMDGYLSGKIQLNLTHLMAANSPTQTIVLDDYHFIARLCTATGALYHKMNLDTLIIDVDSDNPDEWVAYGSWRKQVKTDLPILATQTLMQEKSEHKQAEEAPLQSTEHTQDTQQHG